MTTPILSFMILCFATLAAAVTPEPKIVLSDKLQNSAGCGRSMGSGGELPDYSNLSTYIKGATQINVGSTGELTETLERANLPVASQLVVFKHINYVEQTARNNQKDYGLVHTIITEYFKIIAENRAEMKIAVGTPGSVLNPNIFVPTNGMEKITGVYSENAGHLATGVNIQLEKLPPDQRISSPTQLRMKKTDYLVLRPFESRAKFRVEGKNTVFQYQDMQSLRADTFWLSHYFREVSKFVVWTTLVEWINKNIELVNEGQTPDMIFSNFVRVNASSITVDPALLNFMLYSVSVETWMLTERMILELHLANGEDLKSHLEAQRRGHLSGVVKSIEGIGQGTLGLFGVDVKDPKNLFTVGRSLFNFMKTGSF